MCKQITIILKNNIPVLNRSNANKIISALRIFNINYMDYSSHNTNHKTVEFHIGVLAEFLKNNKFSFINYKYAYNALKWINTIENTRVSNGSIEDLATHLSKLVVNNFIDALENTNKDYALIQTLLISTSKNYLSLISKFCFHLAYAFFNTDCGYSKYDSLVSENLHQYTPLIKRDISKYKFSSRNKDSYKNYCEIIGELCKKTNLSRNELDQIIWVYFKQL